MIIFRNPGLIDMEAVRTMGVSVKRPGSFGYFGTGLKFAIATILRGGGDIMLQRGPKVYRFATVPTEIRGETFNVVKIVGDRKLAFTDQLGKNWEPWMVLRELGCNALDEGGIFSKVDASLDLEQEANHEEGETIFAVTWDKLEEAWDKRHEVFFHVPGEDSRSLIQRSVSLEASEGPSQYAFYRGVRALKLEHRSAFTYNILSEQRLTEDRHLLGDWELKSQVRRLWLNCHDKDLLFKALVLPDEKQREVWGQNWPSETFERHIDWNNDYETNEPSREFLDVCYEASSKNMGERLSPQALALFRRHVRKQTASGGYTSSSRMQDAFGLALEAVGEIFHNIVVDKAKVKSHEELGMDTKYVPYMTDPLGLETAQFALVEDLPDGALSMCEDGRIYAARALLKQPKRVIAENIIRRLLEARYLDAVDMLLPVVLQAHSYTRIELKDRLEPQQEEDAEPAAEDPGLPMVHPSSDEVPF